MAHVNRTPASAFNVTAQLEGTDPALGPVVVMTPRSGWYRCASERAGGIACWLEIMRTVAAAPTRRSVLFVASSGHELGHLGMNADLARREGIVKHAAAWLHLGANIGAAVDPRKVRLQLSDEGMDQLVTDALKSADIHVAERRDGTTVPAGEAEELHKGGGGMRP